MTLVEQIAKNGYEYKRGCSWEKASLCVRNFWLSLAEQMITELRLVQLAEDQEPPHSPFGNPSHDKGYKDCLREMLTKNERGEAYRKVILEEH